MNLSPELLREHGRIMATVTQRVYERAFNDHIVGIEALARLTAHTNRSLGQIGRFAVERIQRHRRELRA